MSEAAHAESSSEDRRDVTRLVNFSDAVVAIAATLLVLPLVESTQTGSVETLRALVDESGRQVLLLLLSILVICRFWLVHHSLFDTIVAFNVQLFWINAGWLVSIVVLPYTTGLIGTDQDSGRVVTSVYVGTMLVTPLASLAMEWLVIRTPALHAAGPRAAALNLTPAVVIVLSMLAALVVAVAVPGVWPWVRGSCTCP
ncbi:MAG: TMEM175 family protein [Cellulomonas sp.]